MIRFDHYQLRIFHQRIHHGAIGAVGVVIGVILCAHDWVDVRDWFRLDIG